MLQTKEKKVFSEQDLDDFAQQLNRDGIVVLPGLLDVDLVESWHDALTDVYDARRNMASGLAAREDARFYLTLPWLQPFADKNVFSNSVVHSVIEKVFKQAFSLVQLGADFPLKGSGYQEVHRDHGPLFGEGTFTPLYALAVNFPLVDVTEANGPLQLARGTHLIAKDEGLKKIHSGEIPLESFYVQKGDVIIRTPLALHRGTPNTTDNWRPMVVMGYVVNWLRTEHVSINVSREYYESLDSDTQKLLRCHIVDSVESHAAETYLRFKY
jgi:ectoine hydroxylase-related dioxygenase (phytanoyl-CoA dioxygenase family)